MVYRHPQAAPLGQVPEERRGRVVGRFCLVCGTIYSEQSARHTGRPLYGRDHIASPCPHEGERFEAGEDWWEPAVEVLPPPPAPPPAPPAA
ncbi:MAG TPA: hypothetical protein VF121_16450 [Thermoanaerobaculia bacterium]|nr:hypothetical protein [Thermoanaerobaculia bacterium]